MMSQMRTFCIEMPSNLIYNAVKPFKFGLKLWVFADRKVSYQKKVLQCCEIHHIVTFTFIAYGQIFRYLDFFQTYIYIYIYIYIYVYIQAILPVNAIVRIPNPPSGDSQGQETILAPSADNQSRRVLKPPSLPINIKVKVIEI